MIKLGEFQPLEIIQKTEHGVYLSENRTSTDKVLLPKKQVEPTFKIGDKINVFIYKDSMDRIIATTTTPKIVIGKLALLEVVQVTKIGAFLDWGLTKDLLLPFKEQSKPYKVGDKVLVSLYIDKSERLCATSKVYDLLRTDSSYKKGDTVDALIISINPKFGAFVAVSDKYNGLIPTNEYNTQLEIGDRVQAFVTEVRPDGKINLSMRKDINTQIDEDAELILRKLKEANGFLPFNDKTDAAIIKSEFNLSKNSFKKAIGRLYKSRKLEIKDDGIYCSRDDF